jgi:hypothetical protein
MWVSYLRSIEREIEKREIVCKTNGIAKPYNVVPAWHHHAEVLCAVSILWY